MLAFLEKSGNHKIVDLVLAARFSNEQSYLDRYLQTQDPYPYARQLPEFFEQIGQIPEDFDPSEPYLWLDSATPEQIEQFTEWLYGGNHLDQNLQYEAAPQSYMEHLQYITKPIWMIHFTESSYDAADIEGEGFQYGHPEFEGIHLTTWKKHRKKEPGYNFAFPLDSRYAQDAMDSGKYGREFVIFKGTGIKVHHYGDNEDQIIFWGPAVNPNSIFKIEKMDPYDLSSYGIDPDKIKGRGAVFVVFDNTSRPQFVGQELSDVTRWIETSGEKILLNVEQKQLNRSRERQRQRSRSLI